MISVPRVPPQSRFAVLAFAGLALVTPAAAQTQIGRTGHNLTPSGPGAFRVTQPAGLCVFCHTPHNAKPTRGLWNRDLPPVNYKIYASSTLEARLNQPTGASRLCLSCHDGTLAMGNLRVTPKGARFALGSLTGRASLGTDLSDDHPVSFIYDSALAARRTQLADPSTLPRTIRLDDTRQMQCTSCHDPHEDRNPKFLRMDNRFSALCTTCHRLRGWDGSSHAISSATWKGSGQNPWPAEAFSTVAENGCRSCHRAHSAGHPERLLAQSRESTNCTVCHYGSVASKTLESDFLKPYRHPVESYEWVHDPKEDPARMPEHVTCVDCHNPHAQLSSPSAPPTVSGRLRSVRGITLAGAQVEESSFEYEVCLKCHGEREPTVLGIVRQDAMRNIRLKINVFNPSFHPIAAPGKDSGITGLEPAYTPSSVIYCTDCHNNDEWTPTGTRPRGPHGSRWEGILEREYEAGDPVTESFASYALCYKCHNRTALLAGATGSGFPHKLHVVDVSTSCAICHDAHGSRTSRGLINFMVRAKAGNGVVTASAKRGRLEFVPDPVRPGHGTCYLTCHGDDHGPKSY